MSSTLLKRQGVLLAICVSLAACGGAPKQAPVATKPLEDPRAPGVPSPAIDAFETGVQAMQAKPAKYTEAIDAFKKAAELYPDYIVAWLNLAIGYEKLGRYQDAADTYRSLIGQRVVDQGVQLALGRALLLSGKPDEAIKTFKELLQSDKANLQAQNNLAAAYLKKQDFETSLDYVKDVLAVQPKNVPAIINLGLLYLKQEKLPLALLMFKKALGYDKKNARAQNNLGLTYYVMSIRDRSADTLPNAVVAFEKAIELDPTMDEARLNVGSVFLDYLDYQRALAQFKAVRKRFPNHYQAMVGEANCLYGVGNYDEAMKLYLETLEMDAGAGNGESILRVGKIYEQQLNKPKKALEYYKRYVSVVNPPKTAKIRQTIMFLEQAGKLQMQQTQQPQPGAAGAEQSQPQQADPTAAPKGDGSEQGGSPDNETESGAEGEPAPPTNG